MPKTTHQPAAVKLVCPKCGSSNIHKDAAAAWNEEAQAWELSSYHDSETCNDCGAEGDWFADRHPIEHSGQFELGERLAFRWTMTGDSKPEVYAWLEDNHQTVEGTAGFYRTTNPNQALESCKASFPNAFTQAAA